MIYFISDAHLRSKKVKNQLAHEQKLVRWLDSIKHDAEKIFMVGDMFDFWFEYKEVVPKGYIRFLGKIAELVDSGIEIHFFIGNHDLWTFGYLEKEVGMIVHKKATTIELGNKKFYIEHGDGIIAAENKRFNIIRRLFHNPIAQKLFALVPPRLGIGFAYGWSWSNRKKVLHKKNTFLGEEKEFLVRFAKRYIAEHDINYFIFGHRHIDIDFELKNGSHVIVLGDFIDIFSFGKFDGEKFTLEYFEQ